MDTIFSVFSFLVNLAFSPFGYAAGGFVAFPILGKTARVIWNRLNRWWKSFLAEIGRRADAARRELSDFTD